MASTSQKPLPSIPRRPDVPRNLTSLTVEGREHLRKIIESCLAEIEQTVLPDGGRGSWSKALENSLDDLGANIAKGGWLTGVKRSRMARKAKRAEETRKAEAQMAMKESDETGKSKGKGKGDLVQEAPRREDKELPKDPQGSPKSHTDSISLALQQICDIAARPMLPTPRPSAKHLLLCLAPIGRDMPIEDSGFDLVPHSASCAFTPGVFSLPEALSNDDESGILFGLNEWDATVFSPDDDSIRVVGGTFVFKGVTSIAALNALSKVLRIAIYVHLSLILEQHFLADSNVALNISKPQSSPLIHSYPSSPIVNRPTTPPGARRRLRNSILPSGIMSFLSRKAENILHKTAGIGPTLGRSGSLDIRSSGSGLMSARSSIDKPRVRLRRLSFRSSPSTPLQNEVTSTPDAAFTVIVKRLEESKDILSSSPGISLSPPALLVSLAAKEKSEPSRVLRADEQAGLKSIRGWDGSDSQGNGMTGILGFVRQQEFSVLHSRHVPSALPHTPPTDGSPSTQNPPAPIYTRCDKPRWITYHFYSRDKGSDKTLGDAVTDLCSAADKPCDTSGCQFKRGEHELRMIHGGLRIVLKVGPREIIEGSSQKDIIEMWESCKTCGTVSRRNPMSDGTYLVSFAKFLELLCYSPAMCSLTPTLCEHTTPPPLLPDFQLPKSRLEIIRHFSFQSHTATVELSSVDDIFDLRVPKLQILRNNGLHSGSNMPSESSAASESTGITDASADEEKKVLKREIKSWWQGVAEHMDKLEVNLTRGRPESFSKSLPRLPSTDDDLDASTPKAHTSELPPPNSVPEPIISSESLTPKAKAHTLPPLPSDTSNSTRNENRPSHKSRGNQSTPPPIPEKDSKDTDSKGTDSLHRLQSLRHSFQRTEQSLYALLSQTPISSLNDVRTSFLSAARGATRRLSAWQKKHLRHAIKGPLTVGDLSVPEPEWWSKSCHAVPGGNIIVREADWGSIIAFTLGSTDYQRELAGMSSMKTASPVPSVPSPSLSTPTNQSSFFGSNAAYKLFSSSSAKPDPDQEDIIWHEPETYSAVISRKEHPRDHTSLLSIREVLRSRPPGEGSDDPQSHSVSGGLPPSAWAKPSVEISKYVVGGVSGLPEVDSVGKLLQEMEVSSTDSSHASSVSGSDTSKSQFGDAHIRRAKASSLLSGESGSTIGPDDREGGLAKPPALPSKNSEPSSPPAQTSSFFASSVTNSLTNAMRFMLNTGESLRSGSPPFKNKHSLLSTDSSNIDERPHIKYDWMIGKRLKFSCTVYYAKQFDGLRRRCGIEDVFLRSVGRSSNWAAEGGKSKSNFWKTSDDRFIIKTLVNAWNVADLSVLIELAPSYFRYMESTWKEPSALAKVLGFYTVEIKNLESGNTQAKVDLLLMENLFYDQKIGKTFDLKGIQGRKVKAASSSGGPEPQNKTLFDGEWLEGQRRALMLVPPHSKVVLSEAVRNDCNFLSKNNIMDYSLLLGVDEEQKRIICGLVDTIGSYTFAKTLEYKAKQGLNAGKDVTVIPPVEYQDRFMKALDMYFLACPDKWSQPLDGSKVINDASLLPCAL